MKLKNQENLKSKDTHEDLNKLKTIVEAIKEPTILINENDVILIFNQSAEKIFFSSIATDSFLNSEDKIPIGLRIQSIIRSTLLLETLNLYKDNQKDNFEKMKDELKAGKKPYKLQLVGLELGGKPIEDYAPDFWLISNEDGGDPVGFLTSPWYHPEKKTNIAMGYVPFDGTLNPNGFPKGKVGTKYKVHLPEKYSGKAGTPVDAVIVDIPFKESFNANTREVVKG